MRRTQTAGSAIVKSAFLWLTIGAVMASMYGALLTTRGNNRHQLRFEMSEPAPVMTASNDILAENAE
tara:strand:- start:3694 stop:3894 length:201 start_codon:yes stop_codon:yes gene_type:complete